MTAREAEIVEKSDKTRVRPATALLALSDRSQGEALAQALLSHGTRVYATTGTATYLRNLGLAVSPAEQITGVGEFLGGRVKTLTPDLFGGILAKRGDETHRRQLAERGIAPLDLVAVTLYPFETLDPSADWEEAVERIDIGGVALLRAAAKNHSDVTVLSSPAQYVEFTESLEAGGPTLEQRRRWARAAFERTASYDAHIARFFRREEEESLPRLWVDEYEFSRGLRYGENPHQEAGVFLEPGKSPWWIDGAIHEGKELSFNNLLDLQAAVRLAGDFVQPACGIVKHNEPSSVGIGETPLEAFEKALAGDPVSAFGGVLAFNREVDGETAKALAQHFLECVSAPSFDAKARAALTAKKRLRVVRIDPELMRDGGWETRSIASGLLAQRARTDAGEIQLEVVTGRAPTPGEMEALHFAWTVCARARSNAVVIALSDRSLGIGSGQTSRIDALQVALLKARRSGLSVSGSVLASDGFFPFGDWVEVAREAGITACIQPGGSMRDAESISACDDAGIAMVFTGRRQFRH